MHTVLYLYLPWLLALLAGFFEFEITHKARGILFGVHPLVAGVRLLLLCCIGMGAAWVLTDALCWLDTTTHSLHVYWVPWAVYITYALVLSLRAPAPPAAPRLDVSNTSTQERF